MNTEQWMDRIRQDGRKIVVFDDDPTGTQTVSDVEVILQPHLDAYRTFLRNDRHAVFVLTNTRAMSEFSAVHLLRNMKADIEQAAAEVGIEVAYVLRGDSTLRGHIFAEMNVLLQDSGVGLFVPAFPECGRVTLGGVHYLIEGEIHRPVCETEFARDMTFGYRSRSMTDWVTEVGSAHGWKAALISLEELRVKGSHAVKETLLQVEERTVVIPDAETQSDIQLIAQGLLDAEQEGANVVVRGASTLARIRCGLQSKPIDSVQLDIGEELRVLVVCGSHTNASTEQLSRLTAYTGVGAVVVPTQRLFDEGMDAILTRIVEQITSDLHTKQFAILSTERTRDSQRHRDLAAGALVMKALTETVRLVSDQCSAVIAKGGITSAEIASDGLGAVAALVAGQLESGVSAWKLFLPDG